MMTFHSFANTFTYKHNDLKLIESLAIQAIEFSLQTIRNSDTLSCKDSYHARIGSQRIVVVDFYSSAH